MSNPIFNSLFQQQNQIQNIVGLYKSGGNPMLMLKQLANNNPMARQIVNALEQGSNPQQMFYSMCQQQGVDPKLILNQLK